MTKFLVPPWFHLPTPTIDDLLAASVIWGFTLGAAFFTAIQSWSQSMAIWRRSHKIQAYVLLIWGEWLSCMGLGILAWTVIVGRVFPDFLISILAASFWVVQLQCICGIIINRISLLTVNKKRILIIRWSVALMLGLINISVFVIWIPARLQISPTWMRINDVWDRLEKAIFSVIDAGLNIYFIYLVWNTLVANGLDKYKRLFYFNCFTIVISVSLDILLITSLTWNRGIIYTQFHAFTYILKLYIELNMADLIAKIVRQPHGSKVPRFVGFSSHDTEFQSKNDQTIQTRIPQCATEGVSRTGPVLPHLYDFSVESQPNHGATHIPGTIKKVTQTTVSSTQGGRREADDIDSVSSTKPLTGVSS